MRCRLFGHRWLREYRWPEGVVWRLCGRCEGWFRM